MSWKNIQHSVVFWCFILLLFFLFLAAVHPLDITEPELYRLETLQQTQSAALDESKAALNRSQELLVQSDKRYEAALQKLSAAASLVQTQEAQLQQLKADSRTLSEQVKKSAQFYSEYVTETEKQQAILTAQIRQKNKIIGILAVFTAAVCFFVVVKVILKIKRLI